MRTRWTGSLAVLLSLGWGAAHAIPPPWLIEGMKAKADLVCIARMGKVEPVRGVRGANARVAARPVRWLKGKPPARPAAKAQAKRPAKPARVFMLFSRPRPIRGPGGIERRIIGGTGHPRPVQGEAALVFLTRRAGKGLYRPTAGAFGYVRLTAKTPQELAKTQRRIEGYLAMLQRLKDANARVAMEGYYRKAIEFAKAEFKRRGPAKGK